MKKSLSVGVLAALSVNVVTLASGQEARANKHWMPAPWALLQGDGLTAVLHAVPSLEARGQCRWHIRTTDRIEEPGLVSAIDVGPIACSAGGVPSYAAGLRMADGRWALFSDYHGGGDRLLQGSLLSLDLTLGQREIEPVNLKRIAEVVLPSGKKASDLFKPVLFERQGSLWIGASAGFSLDGSLSWISEYSADREPVLAKAAIKGVDLRVVARGDHFALFTRQLGPSLLLDNVGSVLVSMENEQGVYTEAPAPPREWKVSTYDASEIGASLWVLGITGNSRAGDWTGELMRLDEGDSEWRLDGTADFQEFPTCIYLQARANQERPDVVCLERGLLVKKALALAVPEEIEAK